MRQLTELQRGGIYTWFGATAHIAAVPRKGHDNPRAKLVNARRSQRQASRPADEPFYRCGLRGRILAVNSRKRYVTQVGMEQLICRCEELFCGRNRVLRCEDCHRNNEMPTNNMCESKPGLLLPRFAFEMWWYLYPRSNAARRLDVKNCTPPPSWAVKLNLVCLNI